MLSAVDEDSARPKTPGHRAWPRSMRCDGVPTQFRPGALRRPGRSSNRYRSDPGTVLLNR